MRHPLGLSIGSVRRPLRSALQLASELRYAGVELDGRGETSVKDLGPTAIRHLKKLLDDHRLSLHALEFSTRRGFADEDALERRMAATVKAMTTAWHLGTTVVTSALPDIPDPATAAWQVLTESLGDLARSAQRTGARLALVPLGQPPERIAALLTAVPDPTIAVALDPAEAILSGYDPADVIAAAGDRLALVYARDATRGRAGRRGVEAALGRGNVEWEELLARLEAVEYRGPLVVRPVDGLSGESPEHAAEFLTNLTA